MHYIWHEIQHGLIHVDHGIFYTIRQLLTVPGQTVREFIDGKRVRHFKPVTLVVVLATVYGLLYHYFITALYDIEPIHSSKSIPDAYQTVIRWTTDHAAYSSLLLILTNTIASWLVFKKQGFNFAEHLVLNTFYRSLSLIVNLFMLPILYFYNRENVNPMFFALTIQAMDILLMYWCYAKFFRNLSLAVSFGLTILTFFVMGTINTAAGFLIGLVVQAFS
ncbi:DUF3667 domain-containing protein [Dyadobacter sp. NIV53]|uniref:DUF3667 domain-containing protein n=1 Tax=Dyadobacter sp. NIV53 TaxID=2861765 RepID=UPI001C8756E2|nr:DUF3667 domain-containing protein [Dyadobacter sp. NIV53]